MAVRKEFGSTKVCKDCSVEKSLSEYYHPKSRNTHAPYCKKCHAARVRKWQKINPDKVAASIKKSRRKIRYGLTDDDIKTVESINLCEICFSDERLVVDHCHDRIVYRGVLCSNCNTAIGLVGNNIGTLEAMIVYLKERG